MLLATQHPHYTDIQHPQLAGRHPTPSTALVLGRQEASRAQANAAGMRIWGNSLDGGTPPFFPPQGILVRRDMWRWRPLVKLIKKPSKLDEQVLYSPQHWAPGPLCHVG